MSEQQSPSQLVVVGSSAGGIEALSTLVEHLPMDLAAPLIVAQHLDPQRPSHLQQILARHTSIPIRTVEDEEALRAATIYLVPANRHVEISDHHIKVAEGPGTPKPSIDLLMRTAAEVFGEGLIAVILTGTGSDGAAGAYDVKQSGGTVVIQDPTTAAFPAMPLALSPSTVDLVSNLEEMGKLLSDLLAGAERPLESGEHRALRGVLDLLEKRHGIAFQNYKVPTIMRRLQRRMAATGQTSIGAYYRFLERHPDELPHLISSLLIKVTEFFRDPELFEYLRERVLPEIVEDARGREREIRIWSAGTASGEEAFTLAMLVAEVLGEDLERFHVRIFATDLDGDAIDFARRAIYPASSLEGLPRELVEKYFTESPDGFAVKKRIRSLTVFGQHDLAERAPFPRIDLMLCRNVLIYFTPELQRHALQLMAFSLRDGGYLVLGKAETTSPLPDYFVADNAALKVYRRRGDRAVIAPARIKEAARPVSARFAMQRQAAPGPITRMQLEAQRGQTIRERSELMLLHLSVGVVVVDRQYDIESINTAARRILGIHGTAIGEDFVHLAQSVPSQTLRGAIDSVFRTGQETALQEVAVRDLPEGEERYLRITCSPAPEALTNSGSVAVIVVTDETDWVRVRRELQAEAEQRAAESARLQEQANHLAQSNAELLEANQDLATVVMELRSANEEFLVGNEELQAATEEVETLNEELQATNEELETLNEELQATVEELNTTNDDLQARSLELQELAVSLESERRAGELERARLTATLSNMPDAVLVVDSSGVVIQTNAAYDQTFGSLEASALREDEGGPPLEYDDTPRGKAARGESFTMEFSAVLPDGATRRFEAHGRAIGKGAESGGGVVVIRDITERAASR